LRQLDPKAQAINDIIARAVLICSGFVSSNVIWAHTRFGISSVETPATSGSSLQKFLHKKNVILCNSVILWEKALSFVSPHTVYFFGPQYFLFKIKLFKRKCRN
jgi:hypothetical protein